MIVVCCAIYFEAKPIIASLKLRRNNDNRFVEEYINDSNTIRLIITGVGALCAASSCASELTYLRMNFPDTVIHVVNIGSCAGSKENVGKAFVVNKITDSSTNRDFFPDMLYRINLPEMPCICSSKMVSEVEEGFIYDMESAGIYASSSSFLSPDRITLIKVVSDSGNYKDVTPQHIKKLIEDKLTYIEELLIFLQETTEKTTSYKIDDRKFEDATCRLHLTTAMSNDFKQLLKYASLSGHNVNDILDRIPDVESKRQGKEIIDGLRNEII